MPQTPVQNIVPLLRRKQQPTPVFLPGDSQGQKSLVGYSAWSPKESDTTERLHFHFLRIIVIFRMLLNTNEY